MNRKFTVALLVTLVFSTSICIAISTRSSTESSTFVPQATNVKTVRFYTSNQTMTDDTTWKKAAIFKGTPGYPTNNAILNCYCYFQYQVAPGSYQIEFRLLVNNVTVIMNSIFDIANPEYQQSLIWRQPSEYLKPNQQNYTIEFQVKSGAGNPQLPQYVKNINILLEVIDGLPAS